MMKRSLIVSAVTATLGLAIVGCMPSADGLVANAPAAVPRQSGRIPATGKYVLYRVNAVEPTTGSPTSVTKIAAFDLQEGERVGFEWVDDAKTADSPLAHLDLIAFAGSARQNLGPITTPPQHYYIATQEGFDHYWSCEPVYGFYNRMTLQK